MKNKIITAIVITIAATISSCNNNEKEYDYMTRWGLTCPVKSFKVKTYSATSKFGEAEKEDLERAYTVTFHESGNTDKVFMYDNDGDLEGFMTYEYNDNDQMIGLTIYNEDEEPQDTYKCEYEGEFITKTSFKNSYLNQETIFRRNGKWLKETETYIDGEYSGSTEYTKHDKSGAEWIVYTKDGDELWKGSEKYNKDGKIVEYTQGDKYYEAKWNGNLPIYLKNAHLEMNTWITWWDSDEDIEYFIEYEFDEDNNWIKQTVFEGKQRKPISISERSIIY